MYFGLSLTSKTKIFKFQFDQEMKTITKNHNMDALPPTFSLPRKSYRIGLFTDNNGCGGATSVKERSCAALISKVERHISDSWFCAIFGAV